MSRPIDCDTVYERLTAGPFAAASEHQDDARIQQHLNHCSGCRELAEALRPALHLLHESLHDDESLPCYNGEGVEFGERRLWDEEQVPRYEPAAAAGHVMWQQRVFPLFATFAALAALVIGLVQAQPPRRVEPPTEASGPFAMAPLAHPVAAHACCTQCHAPNSIRGVPKLTQSCLACHSEMQSAFSHEALNIHLEDAGKHVCCADCHRAGQDHPHGQLPALIAACQTCHDI